MDATKRTRAVMITAGVGLALAALLLASRGGGGASAEGPGGDPVAAPTVRRAGVRSPAIRVSFKLDPRLTQGLYMGDRWVSPTQYQHAAQSGESSTLDARADAFDSRGAPLSGKPTWEPSDPEMVTVSPPQGRQVRITVRRVGESQVKLAYGGAFKDLTVKAVRQNGAWRVDVVQ